MRLLPVTERARQLFGAQGAEAVRDALEAELRSGGQLSLFERPATAPRVRGRPARGRASVRDSDLSTGAEATTLDRVHAAMLLQKGGQANALRALLAAEKERGESFLRLANALSALYPRDSEEKRLVDAMLLAMPR